MNASRNNSRLTLVIIGLVVATIGFAAGAFVLTDRKFIRGLLEWLPVIAAACVLVTALTLTLLNRARPAPAGEDVFDRDALRVSGSTGLRMRGAVDSGGWTYGTGRDDH